MLGMTSAKMKAMNQITAMTATQADQPITVLLCACLDFPTVKELAHTSGEQLFEDYLLIRP